MGTFLKLCLLFSLTYSLHLKDETKKENDQANTRVRRQAPSPTNLTIEVLFVVDFAVFSRFLSMSNGNLAQTYDKLEVYYARVFDGLDRRYRGIDSFDVTFSLSYSDLNVTKSPEQSTWTTAIKKPPEVGSSTEMVDSAAALDRFLTWIDTTKDLPNFDYAILFTGYNLTYGGASSNTGLSYPSSICQNISLQESTMRGPVAIVEEAYTTETIVRAAQELGRSLGSRRDFDNNNCFPTSLFIMAPKFRFPDESRAPNLWKFSPCSTIYFEEYITSLLNISNENCLSVSERSEYIPNVPIFLRQRSANIIGIDDQCRAVYGSQSFLCRALQGSDFGSVCRGAYCYIATTQTCKLILPGDGTLCGNKSACLEGTCQLSEEANETLDDCPFGDQPFIPFSDGCMERIAARGFDCYQPQLRLTCCHSCAKQYTGVPGCEYGDRWSLCNANLCSTYDNYTREVRCCRKCSVRPYSKSSEFTSVGTSPFTEPETTEGPNTDDRATNANTPFTSSTEQRTILNEFTPTTGRASQNTISSIVSHKPPVFSSLSTLKPGSSTTNLMTSRVSSRTPTSLTTLKTTSSAITSTTVSSITQHTSQMTSTTECEKPKKHSFRGWWWWPRGFSNGWRGNHWERRIVSAYSANVGEKWSSLNDRIRSHFNWSSKEEKKLEDKLEKERRKLQSKQSKKAKKWTSKLRKWMRKQRRWN